MAVLFGTSNSRFADFEDPSSGIGSFLGNAYSVLQKYLTEVNAMVAEDTFVEDGVRDVAGFSNFDAGFSNIKEPTRRQVYAQTPKGTVFIKKRIFSSLRGSFDPRFMSEEDKIFIRASKHLFRRKCEEIAFYENLSKLENINDNPGFLKVDGMFGALLDAFFNVMNIGYGISELFDTTAFFEEGFSDPVIADAIEVEGVVFPPEFGKNISETQLMLSSSLKLFKILYKLKEINERSKGSNFTRWVYDSRTADIFGLGPGVGVIELCLVSNLTTTTSVDGKVGDCNLTIEDPYKLTMISDSDIEIALRQALAEEGGLSGVMDVGANFQLEQMMELDRQLNKMRRDRKVSEINFEAALGTGNVTGKIIDINFEFDLSNISAVPVDQALTLTERVRAAEIISKFNSYVAIQQRTANVFQNQNKNFAAIRQRMRNEYAGNSIIQPMDGIHVFLNSNTKNITDVYENRPDVVAGDIIQSFSDKYESMSQELIEQEAAEIAPGVHVDLYRLIRDPAHWRGDGVSVFAGLVQNVSQNYDVSSGQFKLITKAASNMEFLKMTRINDVPSLVQPTKFLDDPLTPFDIETDSASGLITKMPQLSQENINRLPYLRFDDGFYVGTTVKEGKALFQDVEGKGADARMFFQHVPGLIYKWKSGIVTETLNVNMDRPLDGEGNTLGTALSTVPQANFTTPFGNLDAADVVSILVTGQPYNYGNFLKNAMDMGTFSVDNNGNSSHYFNYLFDLLETNKPANGNFVPVKSSVVDPRNAVLALTASKQLDSRNSSISRYQKELAQAQDLQSRLNSSGVADADTQKIIDGLSQKIALAEAAISARLSGVESVSASNFGGITLSTVGNNVQVNLPNVDLEDVNKKIKYTIKRKPEEVRYNKDKNFFIVSNQYDQDTDIQAFAMALRTQNPDLMNSSYKLPFDLAMMTADSLNFELFADPNGNIVFRPPEYNKTPLSLLMKMIALSKGDGTSLAPKFVIDLFQARTNTAESRLLEIELSIHENLTLLNLTPEQADIVTFLKDPLISASLDDRDASFKQALSSNPLKVGFYIDRPTAIQESIAPSKDRFSPAKRSDLLRKKNDEGNGGDEKAKKDRYKEKVNRIARIRNQLNSIAGRTDQILEDTVEALLYVAEDIASYSDGTINGATKKLQAFESLAKKIHERQVLLQTYGRLVQNQVYFSDADDAIAPKTLFDSASSWAATLSGNPDVPQLPQVLKDLIENDLSNDDGPRSGKRFIINDDTILGMNFQINVPKFNRVVVSGNSDNNNTANMMAPPSSIPNLYTAEAVDFDSWRQFGLRPLVQPFHRVDFVSAETQCAPYAVFKLIEQRKRIHSGSIEVIGNEYYQPGDVVYVNNKSMLYYVSTVRHSLNFSNSSFKTSLELEYGHALGDYIPTPLDVIGKGMLSSQRRAYGNIGAKRFSKPSATVFVLDTLIAPNYLGFDDVEPSESTDSYKLTFYKENKDRIQNIIARTAQKVNGANKDLYKIEIRTYYIAPAKNEAAQALNTRGKARVLADITLDAFNKISLLPNNSNKIDPSRISALEPIDITSTAELSEEDKAFRRFPSSTAWGMSNSLINIDGVSLPLNVVDVVFVVDKSRVGDKSKK